MRREASTTSVATHNVFSPPDPCCSGYAPRFHRLASSIDDAFPDGDVEVEGNVGRSGSFEVVIDGKLFHSKFQSHSFPQEQKVIQAIEYALASSAKAAE